MWTYIDEQVKEMFNQDWLDYMKSLDMEVVKVLLFYRKAHFTHPEAHIDLDETAQSRYGINWVLGADDSEMVWYNLPNNISDYPVKTAPVGNYGYIPFPYNELTEIDRRCIGHTPTLVRVDIPHNIVVNTNPRWAISIRFNADSELASWSDTVDYYKRFLVEDQHADS
jgi:hypothetical protein